MAPKGKKGVEKSSTSTTFQSTGFTTSEEVFLRNVSLNVILKGDPPSTGDYMFLIVFNGLTIIEGTWNNDTEFKIEAMPINLNEPHFQTLVLSNPIFFLLRAIGGKSTKQDPDPLINSENRAGGTVDLLPLLLGEEEISTTVHLISITTGEFIGCEIVVYAAAPGITDDKRVPLLLTMISTNCMPPARDGTDYISAMGLTDLVKPHGVYFNQTLSSLDATKVVWATASVAGRAADTAFGVPTDDLYIPDDLDMKSTDQCRSFYWNALNRVLVDPEQLLNRLSSPFLIDVAGVPRAGKQEMRGRYMGWVDAGALLIPGQLGVTVCTKLLFYNESQAEVGGGGLLSFPPTSAKGVSARENEPIIDESGHNSYVIIRFDLTEPIVPKVNLDTLYDIIGFSPPIGPGWAVDQLDTDAKMDEAFVDATVIRKEGGALAIHRELGSLSCQGGVPMQQGIKRSAAHRLLIRVRTMLRNFPPGDCSYIDWQDTVKGQHAASRRAVTASFAPQPPRLRLPDRTAAARCRMAGGGRLGEKYVKINLKVAGTHPRSLLCKILRCLEERKDLDAKNYLLEALNNQTRNRYLLWVLGAQEFNKGQDGAITARAAFRIATKGDLSDGTITAIAWAALHVSHHANGNMYGAHVCAKKMRKSYLLPKNWERVLQRWTDTSGEEEVYWTPAVISSDNPMLITAAFFLCLRCYQFFEKILECIENDCATRGSNSEKHAPCADVYYLKAAMLILKRNPDSAMAVTQQGIQKFGPSALLSQMRLTCLSCIRKWDANCEEAFQESERAGSVPCPSVYFKAALNRFKIDPQTSLQRAALVHEIAPSGHTALLLGRIYDKLGEDSLAERWCAVAVKTEPLIADAWAMLAILAMYQRNLDKARTMLRTARQVGPISIDIDQDLKKVMEIFELDQLPESLVKNLCIENKYDFSYMVCFFSSLVYSPRLSITRPILK